MLQVNYIPNLQCVLPIYGLTGLLITIFFLRFLLLYSFPKVTISVLQKRAIIGLVLDFQGYSTIYNKR